MKEYSRKETVIPMETMPFAYISINKLSMMPVSKAVILMDIITLQNNLNIIFSEVAMLGKMSEMKKCKKILEKSIIYN
jgi:hypothetical protein